MVVTLAEVRSCKVRVDDARPPATSKREARITSMRALLRLRNICSTSRSSDPRWRAASTGRRGRAAPDPPAARQQRSSPLPAPGPFDARLAGRRGVVDLAAEGLLEAPQDPTSSAGRIVVVRTARSLRPSPAGRSLRPAGYEGERALRVARPRATPRVGGAPRDDQPRRSSKAVASTAGLRTSGRGARPGGCGGATFHP